MSESSHLNNYGKPLLRGHFHQAMFFISLGASALLMAKGEGSKKIASSIIYSVALLLMFGISATYHRINWKPRARLFMKRLDHAGIYIMIAGSVTPMALLALPSDKGKILLFIIWSVALLGILQSIFFVNIPKMFSALLYIFMGYLILPYFSLLLSHLGFLNVILLIAGGLSYTIGAIAYGLKRPKFNPHIFGYHEFFHIMVCIGAIFHFIVIYSVI